MYATGIRTSIIPFANKKIAPITPNGKLLYGVCLGILTGLFRMFGGSAEGVSYAIIIGNILVPLIEKVTLPKPFGKGGEK